MLPKAMVIGLLVNPTSSFAIVAAGFIVLLGADAPCTVYHIWNFLIGPTGHKPRPRPQANLDP